MRRALALLAALVLAAGLAAPVQAAPSAPAASPSAAVTPDCPSTATYFCGYDNPDYGFPKLLVLDGRDYWPINACHKLSVWGIDGRLSSAVNYYRYVSGGSTQYFNIILHDLSTCSAQSKRIEIRYGTSVPTLVPSIGHNTASALVIVRPS